jgi:succinate dehydrogenase/fumarate reductase flavoprotein subunit
MAQKTPMDADVVVVGGGGSGLAAAIEAARFGRRVLLLEKNAALGGTTGRSVGSITSSCTELQRRKGIRDTPDGHFDDMALFAGDLLPKDNLELRRLLVDNTPDTIEWLLGLGVVFFGPMPEPPHKLPRMHNILPNSRSYIYHLENRARQLGVEIQCNARAQTLVRVRNRIIGVEVARQGGRVELIAARRAVILACGDYSAAREVKARFVSEELADVEGINPTSTGDGQRMLQEVGAEIVNGDVMLGPEIRFVAPPRKKLIELIPPTRPFALAMRASMRLLPSWLLRPFFMMFVTTNLAPSPRLFQEGAILINKLGQRFVDERMKPQLAIPRQPERVAHIVFDHKVASKFTNWPYFISTAPGVAYAYLADYRRNRRDIYCQAATLEELAGKLGVPAGALAETVRYYNAALPTGAAPIDTPPFYALASAKSWIVITDGGARVTPRLEVLDRGGRAIPGLYAAGSTGQGGLLLEGHGHHLGWALTSGRLAGRHAALSVVEPSVAEAEPRPLAVGG